MSKDNITKNPTLIPTIKPTNEPSELSVVETKMPKVVNKIKILEEKIKIINNEKKRRKLKEYYNYIYYTLTIIAVYISYRCNRNKFKLDSVIYSLFFGPFYLIYKFTTDYDKCFK